MTMIFLAIIAAFLCLQAQTARVFIPSYSASSLSDACLDESNSCAVDISNRGSNSRALIDAFLFYNEIDMLLFRLKEHHDIVDFFVLVESNVTFSGRSKPLYYQDNKILFEEYNSKIIHVVVDDTHQYISPYTPNAIWAREYHQRNSIAKGISTFRGLRYDDVILISDVDEIVNRVNLLDLKLNDVYVSSVHFWVYKSILDEGLSVQDMRVNHSLAVGFTDSGWHFSYFGNVDYIINKINTFSHQEFNKDYIKDPKSLNKLINSNRDILMRGDNIASDGKFCDSFKIDESKLPLNYRMLQAFTMGSGVEPIDTTLSQETAKTPNQLAVEAEVRRILRLYNYSYGFDYSPMVFQSNPDEEDRSVQDRTSILIMDSIVAEEITREAERFLDVLDTDVKTIAPSMTSLRKCKLVHIRISLESIQSILENDFCVQSNKVNGGSPQCHVTLKDDTTSIVLSLFREKGVHAHWDENTRILMEQDLGNVIRRRSLQTYQSIGITQAVLQSYKLLQELRFVGIDTGEDIELSFELCLNAEYNLVLMSIEEPDRGLPEVVQNFDDVFLAEVNNYYARFPPCALKEVCVNSSKSIDFLNDVSMEVRSSSDSYMKNILDSVRNWNRSVFNMPKIFPESTLVASASNPIRILCAVFSMEKNHANNLNAVRVTWGWKCDGFIAYSTVNSPAAWAIELFHEGEESYSNMWQKTRSIFRHIHKHFMHDYDYFFVCGDDTYAILENMYAYLGSEEIQRERAKGRGLYMGHKLFIPGTYARFGLMHSLTPTGDYCSGGSGIMLDQIAVQKLVQGINMDEKCRPDAKVSFEDVLTSNCLSSNRFGSDASWPTNILKGYAFISQVHNPAIFDLYGDDRSDRTPDARNHFNDHSVGVYDTRDEFGRYRMHHFSPQVVYEYSIHGDYPQDWWDFSHPFHDRAKVGIENSLSKSSISFHYLKEHQIGFINNYLYFCNKTNNLPIERV